MKPVDIHRMQVSAAKASAFLQSIANEKRLLSLCHLIDGEKSVGVLADLVGLSQSALSQHLTRLRQHALVSTRREGQTIYYRIADPRVQAVITLLYEQFCSPQTKKRTSR
jgi:ArsR family transcriptional regulator, virulence genes transcriptional regulator